MTRLTILPLLFFWTVLCFAHQLSGQSITQDATAKQELSKLSIGNVSSLMAEQGIESQYRVNLHIDLFVENSDAANLEIAIAENRQEIEQNIQQWFYGQQIRFKEGLPGLATMRRGLAIEIANSTGVPCFAKIKTLPITKSE